MPSRVRRDTGTTPARKFDRGSEAPVRHRRLGLERFGLRRYRAMRGLIPLAMLATAFLTWLLLGPRRLGDPLLAGRAQSPQACPILLPPPADRRSAAHSRS